MSVGCEEFTRALSEEGPMPEAQWAHARACASCALLARVPAALDAPTGRTLEPGPALREALQDARPVVRYGAASRAAPAAAVVGAAVASAALLGRAGGVAWSVSLALTALASVGVALVFWRGADGLGSPPRLRRWFPVAAAAGAALGAVLRSQELPSLRGALGRLPSPGTAVDAVTRAPLPASDDRSATLAAAGIIAALSATAALLPARGTTPRLPALTGATIGASSALLGLSVTHHGAALATPLHVLVVMALTAVCAGLGRRSLSP